MLNKKHLSIIRKTLTDELENYTGKDYIKLEIDEFRLKQILVENGSFAIDFNLVKKLDLSNFNFSKVDISTLDFTNSNVSTIDPQKVLNRDLHLCKLNGVELTGTFDDVLIVGTDFTGSKGARINPEKVAYRNLSCAKLTDAKLTKDVKSVYIAGTDFSGCIGETRIFVDTLIDKDLRYAKFNGTELIGSFRFAKVEYADFSHSKGALIDAQRVYDRSLKGTKLADTKVIGTISKDNIEEADFYGCINHEELKTTREVKRLVKIIKDDFKK